MLYIDDLRRVIPENVEVAMFADDVSLFSSHLNKEVAEAAIQEAITNVAEWSRCRKLTLNTSKCEVVFLHLQLEGGPLEAIVTTRWDHSQHNLPTEVPRSNHRQGPFLRTACRRSSLQSLNRCRVLASLTPCE